MLQSEKKMRQHCPSFPWCSLYWKKNHLLANLLALAVHLNLARWMGEISELKCSWFLRSPLFVFFPLSTRLWKLFSTRPLAHCTSQTRSWHWGLVNSSAIATALDATSAPVSFAGEKPLSWIYGMWSLERSTFAGATPQVKQCSASSHLRRLSGGCRAFFSLSLLSLLSYLLIRLKLTCLLAAQQPPSWGLNKLFI